MSIPGPVLVATDLTEDSAVALVRGHGHATAVGAPLVVCHVIPDVMRYHPLVPRLGENELLLGADLTKRVAELVSDQIGRTLRVGADEVRVVIETGAPDQEIVRIAEAERASLIVIGAKLREGKDRILGAVAERVVRYAHGSVLVARPGHESGSIIVPTDFAEGGSPAIDFARMLVRTVGVKATLLHALQLPPVSSFSGVYMPLMGWTPPSPTAIDQLETLGLSTLEGLAAEHGFQTFEQVRGEPATVIVERAEALDAEMIVMGSRGRTGLARLVLGSVAEHVIRTSRCSVLVARG